jgi:hypothetical protein
MALASAAMTDQEIAAVRNWPNPAPTAALMVAEATDRAPVTDLAGNARTLTTRV